MIYDTLITQAPPEVILGQGAGGQVLPPTGQVLVRCWWLPDQMKPGHLPAVSQVAGQFGQVFPQ